MRPLLLATLLGALTTVVVSWACALRPVERWGGRAVQAAQGPELAVFPRYHDRDVLALTVWFQQGAGWLWISAELIRIPKGMVCTSMRDVMDEITRRRLDRAPGEVIEWLEDRAPVYLDVVDATAVHAAFGWPCPAMMYELLPSDGTQQARALYGGISLPRDLRGEAAATGQLRRGGTMLPPSVALPLRPMAAGFALDTLFFGAAWFILLAGRRAVLYVLRRSRGACRRCGYALRETGTRQCPECGEA